jgi:hypothetical protein
MTVAAKQQDGRMVSYPFKLCFISSCLGLFRLSVVLTAVTDRLGTVRGLTDYSGWLASEPVARGLSGGKSEFSRHPIAPWRTPSSCLFGM